MLVANLSCPEIFSYQPHTTDDIYGHVNSQLTAMRKNASVSSEKRRLAAAKRSRVSIRVTKLFGQGR